MFIYIGVSVRPLVYCQVPWVINTTASLSVHLALQQIPRVLAGPETPVFPKGRGVREDSSLFPRTHVPTTVPPLLTF